VGERDGRGGRMVTEQWAKDAAREWCRMIVEQEGAKYPDDVLPGAEDSLAALIQREAGRCVREHDRHVRFSSFREDKGRMAWAFEEQEDDG